MKKEQFKINIKAPKEKVWEVLWSDKTYPKWTRPFSEGSRAESDWREGSRVLFLNADNEGMIARIAQKKEPDFMSFQHLGMIDKDGNEDTESENVKTWSGAFENYTLRSKNGETEVIIDMDMIESYKDFFRKTWPLALDELKKLAEE